MSDDTARRFTFKAPSPPDARAAAIWRSVSLALTDEEHRIWESMTDGLSLKGRYRHWTEQQLIAHCRNVAEARRREYEHGTGAVRGLAY